MNGVRVQPDEAERADDNARGTVELRIALDTPQEKLLPQLTVNINIITGVYREARTLPRETLLHPEGIASVLLVKQGKVMEQAVRVTSGETGRVPVTAGLEAGAEVIANPNSVKVGDVVESLPAKAEGKP